MAKSRELSLRQLKDIIQDIYVQKLKYDQKCLESKPAKETLEQYMYTYLNQLYGIKSLIDEYSKAILEGVKTYSSTDLDVLLFRNVLHSEIDEAFVKEIAEFKETLKDVVKRRMPKMVSTIENGSVMIEEGLWNEVIARMVTKKDVPAILRKVKEIVAAKASAKELSLIELQNILIDHEIAKRFKKTKRFSELFKKSDTDHNGILNQEEFKAVLSFLKAKVNAEKIVKTADPFNTQQLTFSECFRILSMVTSFMKGKNNIRRR